MACKTKRTREVDYSTEGVLAKALDYARKSPGQFEVHEIKGDLLPGSAGWISPEGSHYFDLTLDLSHADFAHDVVGAPSVGDMLDKGWIRRASSGGYETSGKLSPEGWETLNRHARADAMQMRRYPQGRNPMGFDFMVPRPGEPGRSRLLPVSLMPDEFIGVHGGDARSALDRVLRGLPEGKSGTYASFLGTGWLQHLWESRFAKTPQIEVSTPKLDELHLQRAEKEADLKGPSPWDKLAADWGELRRMAKEAMVGYMMPLIEREQALTKQLGYQIGGKAANLLLGANSPTKVAMLAKSQIEAAKVQIMDDFMLLKRESQVHGLGDALTRSVELRSMEHRVHELEQRKAAISGDVDMAGLQRTVLEMEFRRGISNPREKAQEYADVQKRLEQGKAWLREYARAQQEQRILPAGFGSVADIQAERDAMHNQLTPEKSAQLQDLTNRFFNVAEKHLLEQAHKAGRISDDQYNRWKSDPSGTDYSYVPLNRLFKGATMRDRLFYNSVLIPGSKLNIHFEGSDLPTRDPWEAAIDFAHRAASENYSNHMVETLLRAGTMGSDVYGLQVLRGGQALPAGKAQIDWWNDGKKKSFAVDKEVGEALQYASPKDLGTVEKVMSRFQKVFRWGATTGYPAFAIPFTVQHYLTASILAPGGAGMNPWEHAKFAAEWLKNYREVLGAGNGPIRQALKSAKIFGSGADYKEFSLSGSGFDTGLKEMMAKRGVASKVATSIHDYVTTPVENATKMTVYRRLQANGFNPVDAAWMTQQYGGAPNYSYGARWTKGFYNVLIPFGNAHLRYLKQGADLMFSDVTRQTFDAKHMVKMMAVATLMSLGQAAWNDQFKDEDGTPSMAHLTPEEKANNFVLMRPSMEMKANGQLRHRVVLLPMPVALKMVYNPINAITMRAFGHETTGQAVYGAASGWSPLHMAQYSATDSPAKLGARSLLAASNPMVRVPLEEAANYQGYSGMPVVPDTLKRGLTADEAMPTTSPVTRAMGKVGVPPLRAEHVIRGLTGGMGGLMTSDIPQAFAPEQGVQPVKGGDEAWARLPVVGGIERRFLPAETVDQVEKDYSARFYKLSQSAQEYQQTFDNKKKEGAAQAVAFIRDPHNLHMLTINSMATELRNVLSQQRTLAAQIANSKISNDDKLMRIHQLREVRMHTLQTGVSVLDRVLQTLEEKEHPQARQLPNPKT